jgi:hypothetical protein
MFGLGKKKAGEGSDKPDKKSSSKKSSANSGAWKAWLINHGEKVGLGLFIAFALYLIYSGLSTPAYDRTRTPEVLSTRSMTVKQEIEAGARPGYKAPVPTDFEKAVKEARKPLESDRYPIEKLVEVGVRVSGEKRGDPEIFPPIEVQASCFVGSIAVYSQNPTSKIDEWFNAPPLAAKKRESPTKLTPPRELNAYFDRGFKYVPGMAPPVPFPSQPAVVPGRITRPIEYKVGPKLAAFNVVTAVVPHRKMEDSYKKELESALSVYNSDRDSPNYLAYEVQRVDVTDNPLRTVDESEWKEATECLLERQIKERAGWAGYCDDVVASPFRVPSVLSMPIPPILLWDYKSIVTHPLLATSISAEGDESITAVASGSNPDVADTDSGADISASAADDESALMPSKQPSTEYKLIRFFDFGIAPLGKVYRYRIRVALEDPNYPRAKSLALSSANLKPEVLERVQRLDDEYAQALVAASGQGVLRNSKRLTEWSLPSPPVFSQRPVEVYASMIKGTWASVKAPSGRDVMVEGLPPKSSIVHGEWKLDDSVFVTRRLDAERGTVVSGPLLTIEQGLDVIHPINKTIKWLTPYRFTQPITVVDLRGGQPLAAAEKRPKEKDPLPAQGEVVSFDPVTGNLIISREFENVNGYDMFTFAGESGVAVGGDDAN